VKELCRRIGISDANSNTGRPVRGLEVNEAGGCASWKTKTDPLKRLWRSRRLDIDALRWSYQKKW